VTKVTPFQSKNLAVFSDKIFRMLPTRIYLFKALSGRSIGKAKIMNTELTGEIFDGLVKKYFSPDGEVQRTQSSLPKPVPFCQDGGGGHPFLPLFFRLGCMLAGIWNNFLVAMPNICYILFVGGDN
jgi:hypothetical protein